MCSVLGRERTRTQRNANTAHLFCKGTKQKGMQTKTSLFQTSVVWREDCSNQCFFWVRWDTEGGVVLQKALLFVTEPGGLFQAMRYFGYGRVGKEVSVTKSGAFCNGRG